VDKTAAPPPAGDRATEAADGRLRDGHALEDAGDVAGALQCYREAAALCPSYPRVHLNIGNALRRQGQRDDAAAAFAKALQLAPGYAQAHFNLGSLLAASGDVEGAEREFRAALALDPAMIDAPIALADAYESAGRYADAQRELERALAIDPEHAGATFNLGMIHLHERRFEAAIATVLRAKAIDPDLDNVESVMLFSLNMRSDLDADAVAHAHRIVGAEMTRAAGAPFARWDNAVDPEKRLRIGYVSGDFGFHPVGLFVDPIIAQHDRTRFDVYCYSSATTLQSMGPRMRDSPLTWREVAALDDDALVEVVRADGIDILVDLSGHTNKNRLFAFARHPAPVQATWLGYLNTTGLAAMDYRICDWHTDPDERSQSRHTERLYRLPHSQWCYRPWGDVAPVPRAHPDRPDAIVFGSFNQYPKLSDACIDLWSQVLARVPRSEIVVFDLRIDDMRQRVRDRFARNGVDPARITTRGRENLAGFYAAVGNTDIALDTFPYNGATTTLDVLWMGVPLVALAGERSIARGGVSILRSLGLEELVASTAEEYIELNVRLAGDRAWRAALRAVLRQRMLASPLMDLPGFVEDLESCFREMWRRWCDEQRQCSLPALR